MTQQNNPSTSKSKEAVYRVAGIILVAALVVVSFYLFLAIRLGAWQMYALAGIIALFVIDNGIAMIAINKGEKDRGAWMVIIGMMFVFPAAVLLIDGISVIFGLVLFALVGTVSTQTLDKEQARQANFIALAIGFATALLDLMPLDYRLLVPEIQAFVPAITGVILLTVAFFAIRQSRQNIREFWNSSIRNRLTAVIVASSLVPVLILSGVLGWTVYAQVRASLIQDTFDRLDAIEEIKTSELESYIAERKGDMETLSDTLGSLINETLQKMEAFNTLKRDQILLLFQTWDADVRDVASDPGVIAGMRDLANGFQ